MDKPWKLASHRRPHNLWPHLHEMSRTGKSTETEHRSVVAYSWAGKEARWGGATADGKRRFFAGGKENVLKLDYGDGCILCKLIAQPNCTTKIHWIVHLGEWTIWYINYILIRLLKKKKRGLGLVQKTEKTGHTMGHWMSFPWVTSNELTSGKLDLFPFNPALL